MANQRKNADEITKLTPTSTSTCISTSKVVVVVVEEGLYVDLKIELEKLNVAQLHIELKCHLQSANGNKLILKEASVFQNNNSKEEGD